MSNGRGYDDKFSADNQNAIRRAKKANQRANARSRTANSTTGHCAGELTLLEEMQRDSQLSQAERQRQFRQEQAEVAHQDLRVTRMPENTLGRLVADSVISHFPTIHVSKDGPNRTQCAADKVLELLEKTESKGAKMVASREVKDAIAIARLALTDAYTKVTQESRQSA